MSGARHPELDDLDRSYFAHLDRNDDGWLSRSEWPVADGGFRELDRDGDGRISRRELLSSPSRDREQRFHEMDH